MAVHYYNVKTDLSAVILPN